MASAIDPTKPTSGTATTESVRANFAAAKSEIEALQAALAAVPQGIGSLTMTAGETLATRDVAVLGADLKVYKAAGGSAVAAETTALNNTTSAGAAYNAATNTVVLIFKDPSASNIRIVSGTVNSDGTVTLGTGLTVPVIGSANSGSLSVCHVSGDVFFTAWRSSSTEMSAIAFLANGTTVTTPQAKTTWTTVSSTSGYNISTSVAYEPTTNKVFAVFPGPSTDNNLACWDAPGADCVLGTRTGASTGGNIQITQWAEVVAHGGWLFWFYNPGTTYATTGPSTQCIPIDPTTLTFGAAVGITGQYSGQNFTAHGLAKVGGDVFLACANHGTSTNYRSWVGLKKVSLDAGGVVVPGGTATVTILGSGYASQTVGPGSYHQTGGIAYDQASNKLVLTWQVSNAHYYRTYDLATDTADAAGVQAIAGASGQYALPCTWAVANGGVFAIHSVSSTTASRIWNLRPSRPTNLTSVSYMGFVKDAAAANAPVTVLTSGAIVSGFEGLTPLSVYYALPANTISTVQGADGVQAGVAISPTQLMLRS